MQYKDYYKILGVKEDDDPATIKQRYRRLARKYHPDVSEHDDADEKFKTIQEAYQVLKDPKKKAEYDQLKAGNHAGDNFQPPPGWQQRPQQHTSEHDVHDQGQFSDFFNNMFNARYQQEHGQAMRGQDQHSRLSIKLDEAFHGAKRQISLQQPAVDPKTGAVTQHTRTININIPKGVKSGQQIRLKGLGNIGLNGGQPGDLYIEIAISQDKQYRIKDRDLYVEVPITPSEAALGAKIQVPTLGGKVTLNIQPGAKSGDKLRLKNRGLPGNPSGNQYVTLMIQTATIKTDADKTLYRKMADTMPFNPRQHLVY